MHKPLLARVGSARLLWTSKYNLGFRPHCKESSATWIRMHQFGYSHRRPTILLRLMVHQTRQVTVKGEEVLVQQGRASETLFVPWKIAPLKRAS